MSTKSPQSSAARPPPWPSRSAPESQQMAPTTADPAPDVNWYDPPPPWRWWHWWYDPVPPWWDQQDLERKAAIVAALLAFRRSQMEGELTFISKLIELLPENPR